MVGTLAPYRAYILMLIRCTRDDHRCSLTMAHAHSFNAQASRFWAACSAISQAGALDWARVDAAAHAQDLRGGEASRAGAESNAVIDLDVATLRVEPAQFTPEQFDTVVDTFGLCSCGDPVAVLHQVKRVRAQIEDRLLARSAGGNMGVLSRGTQQARVLTCPAPGRARASITEEWGIRLV